MREKYIYRSELLFYAGLAIYMLAKTIELSTIFSEISYMPLIMKVLRYLSYFIVVIKLVDDGRYANRELIKIIAIFMLLGIISVFVRNNILFCSFFFIVAARNIKIEKMIKFAFFTQLILTIGIALASRMGMVSDWIYNIEGRNRHSLGYIYPSHIASIFFYLVMAYIVIRKEKLKLLEVVIIEGINSIIFVLTDSKTSFALATLAILFLWLTKFYKKDLISNVYSKIFYVYSIFCIAIVSILACLVYNEENPLLVMINRFVNNRLIMGHNALLEYGLSLFGEKIEWVGYGGLGYSMASLKGEYNYVDCSYVKVLLDYGVIFFVIILIGYSLVSYRAILKNDRYMCLCILFMCIYSIIEPRIIEFGFNPFVLTLSALFGKNIREEDEIKILGECNYS